MKYVSDVEPDTLVFRPPCCEQKQAASLIRVVPPHGVRFFMELEAEKPGTLAQLHFRDPVPTHICGGCYQKLYGVVKINGERRRFMRKPDAIRLVWHDALPVEVEARMEYWEDRVGRKRQRDAPMVTAVANARARANIPQ